MGNCARLANLADMDGNIVQRVSYSPFGVPEFLDAGWNIAGNAYSWTFLHQGGEQGAAGLYSFRNRVYSPTLGRWMQVDPIGFAGGDVNLYGYVGNNSNNLLDDDGLYCRSLFISQNLYLGLCASICKEASSNPQFRKWGGGVFTKEGYPVCVCIFDTDTYGPPYVVGQCPLLDACGLQHEQEHKICDVDIENPLGRKHPNFAKLRICEWDRKKYPTIELQQRREREVRMKELDCIMRSIQNMKRNNPEKNSRCLSLAYAMEMKIRENIKDIDNRYPPKKE